MEKHLLTEENLLGMMKSFGLAAAFYIGRRWKKKVAMETSPLPATPKVGGSIAGRNVLFRTHGTRMFPGPPCTTLRYLDCVDFMVKVLDVRIYLPTRRGPLFFLPVSLLPYSSCETVSQPTSIFLEDVSALPRSSYTVLYSRYSWSTICRAAR